VEVPTDKVQVYLVHKKQIHPRTLQSAYAKGPMLVLGGGALSYERGTPVMADPRKTTTHHMQYMYVFTIPFLEPY